MQQKKVVHVLYSGLGGHGSVFFSLVKADKDKSVHNHAIFCGIEDLNPGYRELCARYEVPFDALKKKPGLDLGTYWRLFRTFRRLGPDVIVLHGSAFVLIAWLYRTMGAKQPVIVRETQAHHLKTKRDWSWLKLSVRLANKIIFLTPESLNGVQEKFPKLKVIDKSVIIPYGIDTDLYKPVVKTANQLQVIIGMQSRLQKIKDHPTLLRAFKMLRDKFPAMDIRLRIAGDGQTMSELQQLADELMIKEHVEFCGMLGEGDLLNFMKSLDIYVHATLGETMSNSIMQAMAFGLPIVASDVWGVNNMLNQGETALLVEPFKPEDMAENLAKLISGDINGKNLGKAAREFAVDHYSNQRLLMQYKKLYE